MAQAEGMVPAGDLGLSVGHSAGAGPSQDASIQEVGTRLTAEVNCEHSPMAWHGVHG